MHRSAEILALRLMPAVGCRFKTSWWRGFTEGIVKKLVQENLQRSVGYISNDEEAFSDGQMARTQFAGGRSVAGSKNRRLEKSI